MNNFKLATIISIFLICSNVYAAPKVIKIGTGSILKGYYAIGLDLCKTITNDDKNNEYIKCEVVATNGSIENLKLLQQGKIDLALVQANIAVEAYEGIGYYHDQEKMQNLRQVLNLHDEFFTVIVKDEDKIKVFADIDGKKITNGPAFSSSNITYDAVRSLYKFAKEPEKLHINYADYSDKFCNKEIDAIIMMVGHSNPLVNLIANKCEIDFVSIDNDKITELIKQNSAFHKAILHKGLYPGITDDQTTVKVSAILVTRDEANRDILDKFIGAFHRNVVNFKLSNYLLNNLDINYFADTKNFVLPKHDSVRNKN
ncbi:C4-dicarboxylate ABC transporter substrate-binding protein [Rickettsia amblyommatis]|uniref:TRAP-type transport system, periplasmic protein n=2 Tax=Rickettsia amblyommatis TaxID=33989 RepID=H8K4E2_RICAG|nr:TAXI family TRAP transporter solute-binding subunit [Rickettsia amblyommatis]AFC69386.1 TRAP-type transport system, periplasmic protein [Rickettsia amblyommatis str. GAT-30V]ALA61513.1 C4-dicarboxylate ABC transporter substrate-binding protein [Rickettsia amblyommatis]ARD87624.1 C4-dicarboxylate ABC transporter substrate-binding protein [Rickettsia amblyommatis]KJV61663.1 TRAP transporter solute receptor, TAXI family protein [Rickettsia amblyommatis str. Ac/Pa]KJV97342.1 TRAP transporter so